MNNSESERRATTQRNELLEQFIKRTVEEAVAPKLRELEASQEAQNKMLAEIKAMVKVNKVVETLYKLIMPILSGIGTILFTKHK